MVNILGDSWFSNAKSAREKIDTLEPSWNMAFGHANLKLHLYGKHEPRQGRKMGHFTVIGNDVDAALNTALIARNQLNIATY
jgi:5-(carboxyamino)imidazole ribonucleotide synthase